MQFINVLYFYTIIFMHCVNIKNFVFCFKYVSDIRHLNQIKYIKIKRLVSVNSDAQQNCLQQCLCASFQFNALKHSDNIEQAMEFMRAKNTHSVFIYALSIRIFIALFTIIAKIDCETVQTACLDRPPMDHVPV